MKLQCLLQLILVFFLASPSRAAIFGTDDRELTRSGSTAIAVLSGNFKVSDGLVQLDLDEASSVVCKDQKFAEQTSLSYACTGFLVAPDLIVTAGHCMVNTGIAQHETETYCKAFSWLFDYEVGANGRYDSSRIPEDKLYRCKEVIYAANLDHAPYSDYALVRLERPVLDRSALKLARTSEIAPPLSMVGYPLGMPAIRSSHAAVLLNYPERQSFITNLNAEEGNSGSPVFNRAGEVVGILVAGSPSPPMIDEAGGCSDYNVCDVEGENCLAPDKTSSTLPGYQRIGSEVQRIAPISSLLDR